MINKIRIWKNTLTPSKQLAVMFGLYWVYWLAAWLAFEAIVEREFHSITYHIFHATWMSFFWTITFKWQLLKLVFRSFRKSNNDK